MKKSLCSLMLAAFVCAALTTGAFASEINVFIDEHPLTVPVAPFAENGTTLVPFRAIFEALGLEVGWDGATNTATGKNQDTNIQFVIGSTSAVVNGSERKLLLPPVAVNGTTMVPVRFVAESVGCIVGWDGATQSVMIQTPQKNDLIVMTCNNLPANLNALYTTDGAGQYIGYRQLHGYPDEDLFHIYFKGTSSSFSATSEDMRGLDLDEPISWMYEGGQYTNTRGDIYDFMSDTAKLSSLIGVHGEALSGDWFEHTFGSVYGEWLKSKEFSQDATRLASRYLEKEEGITYTDRYQFADMKTSEAPSEWTTAQQLLDAGVSYYYGAVAAGLPDGAGFYGDYGKTLLLAMPDAPKRSEDSTGTYGGIRMEYDDARNMIRFNQADLIEAGVLSAPISFDLIVSN